MDYDTSRGMDFARLGIAKALTTTTVAPALAAARWGRDTSVYAILQKAAVSGGDTSGDWSGLVDLNAAAREFLDAVAPATILGKLEGLRRVPANVSYVRTATAAIAYWVGESKAIPVSPLAFNRSRMAALKVAALVVFSKELLENASPEAEALVRRDLIRAAAIATDAAFITPTNAGVAGLMPASITNGATSFASTSNLSDDLTNMIAAFGGDFRTAAFVLSPQLAAQIALNTGGKGLGAGLGLRGGELMGLPAIVSRSSAADSDGAVLVLVDAANVVAVDEGAEIALAGQATIEMADNPSGATDTPTSMGSTRVSLFSTDSAALRLTRLVNWAANPGSVVVVTGAAYSSS